MNKFLQSFAHKLQENHAGDFHQVLVVLPSRKASLQLQQYLIGQMEVPFWMPQMFIMPQFLEWLSGKPIVSGAAAITDLYDCYCKAGITNPVPFDSFCQWAHTALNDFGDVDEALANSTDVFRNLKNIREIDGWSFLAEPLSESQISYLSFWDELGKLYDAYAHYQQEHNRWSYHALVKWMCDNLPMRAAGVQDCIIYFAGIASFSNGEMKLLELLKRETQLSVIWDVDTYYVENAMHEAGFFATKYRSLIGEWSGSNDYLTTSSKQVEICETSTAIGQCYAVAQKLSELSPEQRNATCVVLADEKLIEPFLSAIPIQSMDLNLSIGLPLSLTDTAKWISATFRLKAQLMKDKRGVYHKDLMEWLRLSQAVGMPSSLCDDWNKLLVSNVWVFISQASLEEFANSHSDFYPFMQVLVMDVNVAWIQQFIVLMQLYDSSIDDAALEQAAKFTSIKVFKEMIEQVQTYPFLQSLTAIQEVWSQYLRNEKLTYQSESSQGIQIVGMRDTRALDYDTLFVLGVNEEQLPGNALAHSFIPFELRGYYKLPMPSEQEAMMAYLFYRLLQYPSRIFLYYSTISSDFKGTEASRFILQLVNELAVVNSSIEVKRMILSMPDSVATQSAQSINASAFSSNRLDELFRNGISPTAISKYVQCPLDFYYRYVLQLGEEDEVEEQMSSATFGSIVHLVLEKFYSEYKGSFPNAAAYDQLMETLNDRLVESFHELYATHSSDEGYNHLAFVVASDMLQRIIEFEKKQYENHMVEGIRPVLIDVERKLKREVDTSKYSWNKPVALLGKADRIESLSGQIRIIDYKTGKVEDKDTQLTKSWEQLFTDSTKSKTLQLLCYIYMYCADDQSPENVNAGFYSFVRHKKGFMMLDEKLSQDMLNEFEEAFMQWVKQVYSLQNFEHNPNSKYCEYCLK